MREFDELKDLYNKAFEGKELHVTIGQIAIDLMIQALKTYDEITKRTILPIVEKEIEKVKEVLNKNEVLQRCLKEEGMEEYDYVSGYYEDNHISIHYEHRTPNFYYKKGPVSSPIDVYKVYVNVNTDDLQDCEVHFRSDETCSDMIIDDMMRGDLWYSKNNMKLPERDAYTNEYFKEKYNIDDIDEYLQRKKPEIRVETLNEIFRKWVEES